MVEDKLVEEFHAAPRDARDVVLERWYQIVGVVPDFPTLQSDDTEREPRVYHAAVFGDI